MYYEPQAISREEKCETKEPMRVGEEQATGFALAVRMGVLARVYVVIH